MASLMFDSDTPAALADPRFAGARVATYADLVTPQIAAQFGRRLVVIDRGRGDPLGLATVADCETGLLSVGQAVDKVRAWGAEGRPQPTIYHDRDLWGEIEAAFQPPGPWNWVATLDGTMNPDGKYPAAVQILGEGRVGLHVDVSVVWNEAWHPPGLDVAGAAGLKYLARQAASAVQQLVAAVDNL